MDFECESGNCGSTYFRVGDDGFTYCSEGHRQFSRGTQVAEENEGAPQFGRKARRQVEEEEAADNALSGKRAFEHYLLCFQLILWKQTHWLISNRDFPPEFETIVHDLWALRLQTLQSRANYDSESEAEQSSQMYSSQSEAEATDVSSKHKAKRSKTEATPQLVDALSYCYIASLLLRLPITIHDLYSWAASGELVYYRAVRSLTSSMKQRLPFNYNQALDPQTTLKSSTLHRAVSENIAAYHTSFGMSTPAINHILVLYRWLRLLALPLEVYSAVLRLARMLGMAFSYDMEGQGTSRLQILKLPEAKLMGLVVIATKLLFPMDGLERYSKKPTDLSAMAMDWSVWSAARQNHDYLIKETVGLRYEDALHVSENDILDMSNDKLDDYMDWYGSTLVSEDVREKGRLGKEAEFRRAMFRFFPIDRQTNRSTKSDVEDFDGKISHVEDKRIKEVQGALRPNRMRRDDESPKEDEVVYRHGSVYKRFREARELSGFVEEFYKEAARISAVSLQSLVQCVFSIERRLQEWEDRVRMNNDMED